MEAVHFVLFKDAFGEKKKRENDRDGRIQKTDRAPTQGFRVIVGVRPLYCVHPAFSVFSVPLQKIIYQHVLHNFTLPPPKAVFFRAQSQKKRCNTIL
jgi:hypothetical protein